MKSTSDEDIDGLRRTPSALRLLSSAPGVYASVSLEPAALLLRGERLRELVELPAKNPVHSAHGELDAVVGDAVLREVVGADLLRALAGPDLGAPLGGDLRLLLGDLPFEQP